MWYDIIFAITLIGGALYKFLTAAPTQRKEKGCLFIITIIAFTAYFLLLPPEREDEEELSIENLSVPAYLK